MQPAQRSDVAWTHGRWRRAGALAAAVALAHALLLTLATRAPREAAPRAPVVEVRQLAAAPQLEPVAIAQQPAAAVPAPPERAARRSHAREARPPHAREARPSNLPPARDEPPRADVQSAPSEAPHAPTAPLPTRIPPSAELVFALQHGDRSGEARLSWRADGERYALSLQATLPSGREIEQHSQGGFDAAGLAPLRLADRRRGRDVRAANFQREHGKITFSGPRWELPLESGTQDRLSWLVQLVALAGAANDGLRDGSELAMPVVGARGALSHWRFEVRGRQRVELDGAALDAWWLVREPVHPYDVRIEVWLGAQQGHWPLKLRQTQIPGGEPLEWLLRQHAPLEAGT